MPGVKIMAENLNRELRHLKQAIVDVGSLAEDSLAKAVRALTTRDERLAREVIYADREIDRREVAVEEDCLKILALYQPVALDLRFVVAVIKINNEVERIGDLAASIAKRVVYLSRVMEAPIPVDFREMAFLVQTMVKRSLDALVNTNVELAQQVRDDDDLVDALHNQISEDINALIAEHPEQMEWFIKLNAISRHLERLADMAACIAEEVMYMVEGSIVRHRAGA
jgi:phosphate transport system protein